MSCIGETIQEIRKELKDDWKDYGLPGVLLYLLFGASLQIIMAILGDILVAVMWISSKPRLVKWIIIVADTALTLVVTLVAYRMWIETGPIVIRAIIILLYLAFWFLFSLMACFVYSQYKKAMKTIQKEMEKEMGVSHCY